MFGFEKLFLLDMSSISSILVYSVSKFSMLLLFGIIIEVLLENLGMCFRNKKNYKWILPTKIATEIIYILILSYAIFINRSNMIKIFFIMLTMMINMLLLKRNICAYDKYVDENKIFQNKINWFMLFYLLLNHILAFIALFYIDSWFIILETIIWSNICGVGVTVGMHRLWAHRSYKAKTPLRVVLMLLASASNQGSIFHWCRDHRIHHKYSDTDKDPHNITRGFFYAHCGWLLLEKDQKVKDAGKQFNYDDLMNDWVVKLNESLYPHLNQICCYIIPGIYGLWRFEYAMNGFVKGFLIFGVLRWIYEAHGTWCVNSVAHTFGYRPYKNIPPVESLITAVITNGEGWHNFHHTYSYDYATSEYGILSQINMSKLIIDFMWLIGQAYDLKRVIIHRDAKNNIIETEFKMIK